MLLLSLRDAIIKFAIQALIIQYCVNTFSESNSWSFHLSWFETFLVCVTYTVLTYDARPNAMFASAIYTNNALSSIANILFNTGTATVKSLNKVEDMLNILNDNIGKHMKLKDVKPLDKLTPSVEEIAKKHNVSVDVINKELEMGVSIEKEHTSDDKVAREIALDHLAELPDYYTKLKKVENDN